MSGFLLRARALLGLLLGRILVDEDGVRDGGFVDGVAGVAQRRLVEAHVAKWPMSRT